MIQRLAGLWAAIAIAAGAFGAHGASGQAAQWLETGAFYQLVHAVAVLVIAEKSSNPAKLMLFGSAVFAGALYGLAMGGPNWLGAIAPIGGTAMIAAWLWFALGR